MTTSKERIQGIAGAPSFTGEAGGTFTRVNAPSETDPDGVLKELTAHQIERMSRDAVLAYQEKRAQQIADNQEKANERYDFEVYKRSFVEAGGKERDAEASWQAHRTEQASRAARTVADEALHTSRRRVRRSL